MLRVENISKQYKTGDFVQKALDSVSLNLRDSEFVAILGPSGSGKTTLLNIIGGLDRYDGGDLVINGTSTRRYTDRDWDSYRNHTVGFVFQSYNLIGHQTILSNVELALTISGVGRKERRERARRALQEVGLGEHVDKLPNQLSGGQMQRVAIARALVNNPDIVLADEPTGALDSETSVQIMELLKNVAKDRLVVMVTHNPELAQEYATRSVRLQDGVIRGDSDPFELDEAQAQAPVRHRNLGRASMSLATSIALSFNNLKTKKGRTFLTSFAGSIGIIGIALILSVSTGVNRYIENIQRDTMTSYPLSIQAKSFDVGDLMATNADAADESTSKEPSKHNDGVYADDSAIKKTSNLTSSITENNLSAFKKYLDDPKNDIHRYVGSNGIQYSYDARFSVYSKDPKGVLVSADGVDIGADHDQAATSKLTNLSTGQSLESLQSTQMSMLTGKSSNQNEKPNSFNEIMPSAKDETRISSVVHDNYKVLSGSWPKSKDQVVLVLDHNNQVPIATLYGLGLLPESDYNSMMGELNSGRKVDPKIGKIDFKTVMDHELSLVPAYDLYQKGADGNYDFVGDDGSQVSHLADAAMKLKVVGIVKPVDSAKTLPLPAGVGYTRMLMDSLIEGASKSPVVTGQEADPSHNVLNGLSFKPADAAAKAEDARKFVAGQDVSGKVKMARSLVLSKAQSDQGQGAQGQPAPEAGAGVQGMTPGAVSGFGASPAVGAGGMTEQQISDQFDAYIAHASQDDLVTIYDKFISAGTYKDNLSAFGVVGHDAPSGIKIYVDSFEAKNSVVSSIDHYNKTVKHKADKIVYTDYVGLMMNSVTTIINVITYVLIAFVGISLVVSSIMIGIITYISVLERTKEIGILRAMGASKHNVSQVFDAETGIIGLCSGLLGILVTLLLLVPGNSILHHFMGTTQVSASLPVGGAVALILLSMVLTLIGGIIPSHKAAKQDPATALRTE